MEKKFDQLVDEHFEIYENLISDKNYYYLYKHISIDSELNILGMLNNCCLKYTTPIDFNDPYDCHFKIKLKFNDFNKNRVNKLLDAKYNEKTWGECKEELKTNIQNVICNPETVKHFRSNFAVTCFNSNPLSMLMWSHYAMQHKGVLVEFKFLKSEINLPTPVVYTNEYPVLDISWYDLIDTKSEYVSGETKMDTIKKLVLYKSSDWSYENEFRNIKHVKYFKNKSLLLDVKPEIFSSFIFGTKMSEEHKRKFISAIGDFNIKHGLNIKHFQAELKDEEYKLKVPKHPRLDQI